MKPTKLNSSFIKLVNILSDGQYHDGTTIGEALSITRSAVWKAIKKLEHYGVQLDSIKGKGYALKEPLHLLDKAIIKKNLRHKKIIIDIFENIDSTNDYLKSFYNSIYPRICLAENQAKGKGRLQREWFSPFAKNIYFSCLYHFPVDISKLAGLSLVVSLAILKTIKQYCSDRFYVKWPNDIIYDNKKLSGNLIELEAESNSSCSAIIGIGINVNMLAADENNITQPWTSLRKITGNYVDRNLLLANLINTLFSYLEQFEKSGLDSFIQEWEMSDYLFNKTITIKGINHNITGNVKGIDKQGHLLLTLANGNTQSFSSGDTVIMKK